MFRVVFFKTSESPGELLKARWHPVNFRKNHGYLMEQFTYLGGPWWIKLLIIKKTITIKQEMEL